MSETDWAAVHRMEAAANRAMQAACMMEAAALRIGALLEYGYGGNGLRLLEALDEAKTNDDRDAIIREQIETKLLGELVEVLDDRAISIKRDGRDFKREFVTTFLEMHRGTTKGKIA